jgi:hypothetical protein
LFVCVCVCVRVCVCAARFRCGRLSLLVKMSQNQVCPLFSSFSFMHASVLSKGFVFVLINVAIRLTALYACFLMCSCCRRPYCLGPGVIRARPTHSVCACSTASHRNWTILSACSGQYVFGLQLPRVSHYDEPRSPWPGGLTSPVFHACGNAIPLLYQFI